MSGGITIGFVDVAVLFVSIRSRSLRFGWVVSGTKLVRLRPLVQTSRNDASGSYRRTLFRMIIELIDLAPLKAETGVRVP
jgi:hypothetical protein